MNDKGENTAQPVTFTAEQVDHKLRDMLRAGLTQRDLATRAGVSPTLICHTLSGTRKPCAAILRLVGLKLAYVPIGLN